MKACINEAIAESRQHGTTLVCDFFALKNAVSSLTLAEILKPFDAHYCHVGTAINNPVGADRVKPSFVIFDIRAL